MSVMNIGSAGFGVSPASRTTSGGGGTGPDRSAASGNALPVSGQARQFADIRQNTSAVSTAVESENSSRVSTQELRAIVDQTNVSSRGRFSNLKFTVAEGTEVNVVRIEDTETGKLIRQIPSETMVAIARALDNADHGMMLKEEV